MSVQTTIADMRQDVLKIREDNNSQNLVVGDARAFYYHLIHTDR